MEYAVKGLIAPLVGMRDSNFKFIHCPVNSPQLIDLASGPDEMHNFGGDSAYAVKKAHFTYLVNEKWYMDRFYAEVRESQA